MYKKNAFTCYLIGDDHLLVQCAEIILQKGHHISGIISHLNAAKVLASEHKIDYFETLDAAVKNLSNTSFDYLFSIVNSSILPEKLLKCAQKLSINFHNAPLPRYAGVHALSWAILNNELFHGVTWHVMTEMIDGGDILKQALFPIDPHETALSLSLKCYEHALTLFTELVDDLGNQTLVKTPQNLNQRSYYDFNQKPCGNGWISWENTALDIERIIRALDLGHYHHNRLASPKMLVGNTAFVIGRLHVLHEPSTSAPGTLVKITPEAWHISTNTSVISVEHLLSLDGKPITLDTLVQSYDLYVGYKFQSPTHNQLTHYKKISEHCAKWELFWMRKLTDFRQASLPFQPPSLQYISNDRLTAIAHVEFPKIKTHLWETYLLPECKSTDLLLTAILIYIYRMGNKEESGLWYHASPVHDTEHEIGLFFAPVVPFSIPLNNELSFQETIDKVREVRSFIESKCTFQQDIFYRYPELGEIEHKYPLTLLIGEKARLKDKLKSIPGSLVITLSSDTHEITWWIKQQLAIQEPKLHAIIKTSTEHLNLLLDSIPSTIHQPISKLNLLGDEERKKIMHQWNTIVSSYPKEKTVTQVFENQVLMTPNNIAVTYGKKSLTYSELNQKANQLARYLKKKGLSPNTFAAICTSQELHLIIGILAILKTGAAYIPIDAGYPKHHMEFLLEDSKPTLLLASHKLSKRIEEDCVDLDIPVVLFDMAGDLIEKESINNLDVDITPQSLAYIIYTSGTTGKPKGVMVPHRGINRLVKNTNYINISEKDKIAQAASVSFDAATFEIWGALLNGATLIAIPHATLLDATKFSTFLEKEGITILWLTSALFNQHASLDPSMFKHLTYLLVGGDVLNKERIMSVLMCEDGAPKIILNGYGPTENTTFTTTYHITEQDKKLETIPIGKPIANSVVYILDDQLQPTPIGAIGELYTGGDGLALGYLNRPELTEEKFINNPFSDDPKSKLYKTGDSVRWMPDGQIEYIGRQDNQVKIRGFRVELEAIQAHLLHHNAISQCCVRAEESSKHTKTLVAYIVCSENINDKELKDFIAHQLPSYMIPSFFVRLDKMPLTTNGKVNYQKLPKPNFGKAMSTSETAPPVTPLEKSLATLWSSLLGCDDIGLDDNFFDLGGHSLLITQLILQVKENYKADLPLHEFLESPSIRHLTQLIEGHDTKKTISFASELFTDRFLKDTIKVNGDTYQGNPKGILLTGVTGFLGAHLLYDLYHTSKAKIYCLVRADNEQDASKRLNATLKKYQLQLKCNDRIIPLRGDLSKPNLGLDKKTYAFLTKEIDLIIHNGAAVNHLYNYELLRGANVLSTVDIINLATTHKIKPIHYVSTLSAAGNFLDKANHIREDFIDAEHTDNPPLDGYSQTKWVSEQLLAEVSKKGLSVNIYRPGWIVGQTHTGAINAESNHLLMLLKGCIQLKTAPNWNLMLDMLPVDLISTFIANQALSSKKTKVFNLINPNKISWVDLIHYINQRGYPVSLVDPMIWKEKHLKSIDKENALYTLYPLYVNSHEKDWMKGLSNISSANSYNTNNCFTEKKLHMPLINKELLDIYFNYLEKTGFL